MVTNCLNRIMPRLFELNPTSKKLQMNQIHYLCGKFVTCNCKTGAGGCG